MTREQIAPSAPSGGRLARRRAERRARRRARQRLLLRVTTGLAVVAVASMLGLGAVALIGALDLGGDDGDGAPSAEQVADDTHQGGGQDTLLLVRTRDDGRAADSATLLATGPGDRATVVLIPTGTLVSVPGVGLDRLGLAGQYGGTTLLQASVENLLGISIDQVAAIDGEGLVGWLDRLDGVGVDVATPLVIEHPDGTEARRFEPGRQRLDGGALADYWSLGGTDDELAALTRQRRILDGLLAEIGDPAQRRALVGDDLAPLDTDADAGWVDHLLAAAADAHAEGALRFQLLPVERFGGTGPDGRATYRSDDEEVASLRERFLAASVPDGSAEGPPRVQILNGVGVPGVGQRVEQALGGGSFRIVATDNAASFDEEATRIIVYGGDEGARTTAERVRERLGVGTITVSRQPQSVVDLTIVVGGDFLDDPDDAGDGDEDDDADDPEADD